MRNAMRERPRIRRAAAVAAAERAAAILAGDSRVRLVYLFGSAVDPGVHTVRDVDLAVLLEPPPTFDELLRLRADLVSATGAPLDLVPLDRAPVVLAHEIAETGRCLHADPPERETEFVVRARARYWDWKPFLDEQWRILGERLEDRRGPAT
jgi:predicted nucleotidyltransferase